MADWVEQHDAFYKSGATFSARLPLAKHCSKYFVHIKEFIPRNSLKLIDEGNSGPMGLVACPSI